MKIYKLGLMKENYKKITPFVIACGLALLAVGWYGVFTNKNKLPSAHPNIVNGVFTSQSVGWSIAVPEGWEIMPNINPEIAEEATSKYRESGIEVDLSSIEWLVGFKKDDYNFFRAFSESSTYVSDEHLAQSMAVQRENLPKMFPKGWTIKDVSPINTEYVNGRKFLKFSTNVLIPQSNTTLSVISYLGIIDDNYFGVSICTANALNNSTLVKAWRESKFER